MFGRPKTETQDKISLGTYKDLQKLSEKHCDGEITHEAYRSQLIDLIGHLPDAELTKMAEATMSIVGLDE